MNKLNCSGPKLKKCMFFLKLDLRPGFHSSCLHVPAKGLQKISAINAAHIPVIISRGFAFHLASFLSPEKDTLNILKLFSNSHLIGNLLNVELTVPVISCSADIPPSKDSSMSTSYRYYVNDYSKEGYVHSLPLTLLHFIKIFIFPWKNRLECRCLASQKSELDTRMLRRHSSSALPASAVLLCI